MSTKQSFTAKVIGGASPKKYSYEEIKCIKGIFEIQPRVDLDNQIFISDGRGYVMYISLNQPSDCGNADPWRKDQFSELRDCVVEIVIK